MVRKVWVTPNAEEHLMYIARVSNTKNQESGNPKLIRYLIDNKHWSPFEMVNLTVEIETSMAIGEQILRHRSFSFQKFSGRYAELPEILLHGARLQDHKNRQNSIETEDIELQRWWSEVQFQHYNQANKVYREALDKGIAKEVARFILPAATKTKLYMNGNLRSWIHYLLIRDHPHTQKEHQQIAQEIKAVVAVEFPITFAALGWKI